MEIAKLTTPDEWQFFAQGAANILFQYTGPHGYLRPKLLRIRLAKNKLEYINTCELFDFIELQCKPLFPQYIHDVQLVLLSDEFVGKLNSHGQALMTLERYGLLVPNMLNFKFSRYLLLKHCQFYVDPDHPVQQVMFEIKPKWLYTNINTNYCRSCLLNIHRGFPRHFCPLDFLMEEHIDTGVSNLLKPIPEKVALGLEKDGFPLHKLFSAYLNQPDNVFLQLMRFQEVDDTRSEINDLKLSKDVLARLSLVMTLRDIGVFLRFERYHRDHGHKNPNLVTIDGYGDFIITCNIIDLDLKSLSKFEHWKATEAKLAPVYNSNSNWPRCHRPPRT